MSSHNTSGQSGQKYVKPQYLRTIRTKICQATIPQDNQDTNMSSHNTSGQSGHKYVKPPYLRTIRTKICQATIPQDNQDKNMSSHNTSGQSGQKYVKPQYLRTIRTQICQATIPQDNRRSSCSYQGDRFHHRHIVHWGIFRLLRVSTTIYETGVLHEETIKFTYDYCPRA